MVATVEQIMAIATEIEQLAGKFAARRVASAHGPGIPPGEGLLDSYSGQVQAMFAPLLTVDPSFFEPMIQDANAVAAELGRASEQQSQVKTLQSKLGDDWTGDTATVFFNDYVNRHHLIVANQQSLANTLAESMQKNKEIYEHSRDIMLKLATATRDALKNIVEAGPSLQDFKIAVSILALIGAGAATFVTAGAAAPAAAGAAAGVKVTAEAAAGFVAITAALGQVGAEVATKAAEIRGKNPKELLMSLQNALADVSSQIVGNTKRITDGLTVSRQTVENLGGAGVDGDGKPFSLIVVKRPAIADVDLKNQSKIRSLVMPDDD